MRIDEQRRVQRDVVSLHSRAGMQQAIGANYFSIGITEYRELLVYNVPPEGKSLLRVVHADGDDADVERVEVFFVLRELAQLASAIRSPVTTIKDQEHSFAAHGRKVEWLALLIL